MLDMESRGPISRWSTYKTFNLPTSDDGAGREGWSQYVSFKGAYGQYVDLGSQSLVIDYNGGFTLILYMSFNGTGDSYQQILNVGSSESSSSLLLGVNPFSSELNVSVIISGSLHSFFTPAIVRGEWAVYTVRYSADSQQVEILKNGLVLSAKYIAEKIPNIIQEENCVLGTADVGISGFYLYDRYLDDSETAVVSSYIGRLFYRYVGYYNYCLQ